MLDYALQSDVTSDDPTTGDRPCISFIRSGVNSRLGICKTERWDETKTRFRRQSFEVGEMGLMLSIKAPVKMKIDGVIGGSQTVCECVLNSYIGGDPASFHIEILE